MVFTGSISALDCRTQYQEMLSFVAQELESDQEKLQTNRLVMVRTCQSQNLNKPLDEQQTLSQTRHCQASSVGCLSSTAKYRNVKQCRKPSFSSSLSDPFDDFIVSNLYSLLNLVAFVNDTTNR